VLLIYKAARVREYLQENLRILSALQGDTALTSYGARWQAPNVFDDPPTIGESALIIFSDPPYEQLTPVRFATVTEASRNDSGFLSLGFSLGPYVHVQSAEAWRDASRRWAGPGGTDRAFLARGNPDRVVEPTPDPDRSWRRLVERLSRDPSYDRAVFGRITDIQAVGSDVNGQAIDARALTTRQSYVIRLAFHNPHLDADARRRIRILPIHDELAVSAVVDDLAMGVDRPLSEVMFEPLRPGAGSLEIHASRGTEFLLIGQVTWTAEERRPDVEALPAEESPVAALSSAIAEAQETSDAAVSLDVPATLVAPMVEGGSQAVADAIVRAYRLAERAFEGVPQARLEILRELKIAVPDEWRLLEHEAIALYEAGEDREAARILRDVPLDSLTSEGRSVFIAAAIRQGQLPEPIERVQLADWTNDQTFIRLLDASAGLSPADLIALSRHLAERVLSEGRAQTWLNGVADRNIPRSERRELIDLLGFVDPVAASQMLEQAIDEDRLSLTDERTARLAYDLGTEEFTALRVRATQALVEIAARNQEVEALRRLLTEVVRPRFLHRDDLHDLGEHIIRHIADLVPQRDPIDEALLAAAEFIEDYRQAGDFERAARLAAFVRSNDGRASAEVRDRVEEVLAALNTALDATDTFRKYLELRDQEANLDLRREVAQRRFLLVGGKRGEWYSDFLHELALDERSEWFESEPRKAPPLGPIEEKLKSGRYAAVVCFTSHIGHKTSTPVVNLAKKYQVRLVTPKTPSRESLIASLREHFVPGAPR
jgi:hypothetical protein